MPDCIVTEIIGGQTAVAHLKGEIDVHRLPEAEAGLKPLVENSALTTLVLDARELTFIDSKVVGYIAYLRTTYTKSGRHLCLVGVNETVNDILSLVGLMQVIPHFATLDEALKTPAA